jgi:hypothetical protein
LQLIEVDTTAAEPSTPTVTGGDLINKLGVHIDKRFYAMESVSGGDAVRGAPSPTTEDPSRRAGEALVAEIAKILSKEVDSKCGITPIHVLNRMGAMTCGGCHRFSRGTPIAPGINWPRSEGRGFVHISGDGLLSELLTTRLLPFRFAIVERLAGGGMPFTPTTEMSPLVATNSARRAELARLLDSVRNGSRHLLPAQPETASVTPGDFATVERLSNEVRSSDAAQPGAFVVHRKPD